MMSFWDRLFGRAEPAQVEAPRAEAVARTEAAAAGWANNATGMGVEGYDGAVRDYYAGEPAVSETEARWLWSGDAVAARLAEALPSDAWAPGWRVDAPNVEGDAAAALTDAARLAWRRAQWRGQGREGTGADGALLLGLQLARIFGGAVIVAGHADLVGAPGALASSPWDGRAGLLWLRVYQRWEVTVATWGTDPEAADYGRPRQLRISPRSAGGVAESPYIVHAGRCLLLYGPQTDAQTAAENNGWGDSVYRRLRGPLRRYSKALVGADELLRELGMRAYGVFGLAQMNSAQGGSLIASRLQVAAIAQGRYRAAIYDKERESVEFRSPTVSGVEHLIEAAERALCAAAGMPRARLFGDAPAGLSTDDASGQRTWHDQLESYRDLALTPAARQMLRWVCADEVALPEGADIALEPLGAAGALEQVQEAQGRADVVATLVGAGVPLPAAVQAAGLEVELDVPSPLTDPAPSAIVSNQDAMEANSGQ
jgi:phage-related protein (TIGR01555 family)